MTLKELFQKPKEASNKKERKQILKRLKDAENNYMRILTLKQKKKLLHTENKDSMKCFMVLSNIGIKIGMRMGIIISAKLVIKFLMMGKKFLNFLTAFIGNILNASNALS